MQLTYSFAEYTMDPCEQDQYWHDIDDFVFTMDYREFPHPSSQSSTSVQPPFSQSDAPSSSTNPTLNLTINSESFLVAAYNRSLQAPQCSNIGSSCLSGRLLDGSGSMAEGSHHKSNAPNTIYNCRGDQEINALSEVKPIYCQDKNIDKIFIQSVNDGLLREGKQAELEVTVWLAQDTSKERIQTSGVWSMYTIPQRLGQTMLRGHIYGLRLWCHHKGSINSLYDSTSQVTCLITARLGQLHGQFE